MSSEIEYWIEKYLEKYLEKEVFGNQMIISFTHKVVIYTDLSLRTMVSY